MTQDRQDESRTYMSHERTDPFAAALTAIALRTIAALAVFIVGWHLSGRVIEAVAAYMASATSPWPYVAVIVLPVAYMTTAITTLLVAAFVYRPRWFDE